MRPAALLELFVAANLAFLAVDIFVAHSVNRFAHAAEWIPFVFSVVSPALLVIAAGLRRGRSPLHRAGTTGAERASRALGVCVGLGSVGVGVAGMVYHLESQFFELRTLESLVYTAPFSAPLAYAGLGLLLLLVRMVADDDPAWPRWVLLIAAGGFFGNFVLSLADHAQNGFFNPVEWLSVAASAFAFSFTLIATSRRASDPVLRLTGLVVFIQAVIGLGGFALHVLGNLSRPGDFVSSFVFGAPVFAPLLFVDLALLAALGLYTRLHPPEASTPA